MKHEILYMAIGWVFGLMVAVVVAQGILVIFPVLNAYVVGFVFGFVFGLIGIELGQNWYEKSKNKTSNQ